MMDGVEQRPHIEALELFADLLARVEGEPITEGDLAFAAEDPALALPGMDEKQKREVLVGYLIDLKLGAKAAERAKLDQTPEFKRRLAYMRDKLLVDEYLDSETKKAVSPEAARKLFDETAKAMPAEEEVRARHILVESEDEAKQADWIAHSRTGSHSSSSKLMALPQNVSCLAVK